MPFTVMTAETDCMPQSLRTLASSKGLQTHSNEITYSEDQGLAEKALICVERVLDCHDVAIRLHVRVLRRETVDALWEPLCDTPYSDMLTHAEAVSLINHWGHLQQEATARNVKLHEVPATDYIVFFDVEAYQTKEEFEAFSYDHQTVGFYQVLRGKLRHSWRGCRAPMKEEIRRIFSHRLNA